MRPEEFKPPFLRWLPAQAEAEAQNTATRLRESRPLIGPTAVAGVTAPARPGALTGERSLGLVASLLLHVLVAAVVLQWRDALREQPETAAIPVELATVEPPPAPYRPPAPPKEYLLSLEAPKLPEYATTHGPLLQLDPTLKLNRLRRATPGHGPSIDVPEAESGDVPGGDVAQNYALVVLQMVRVQLQYPASAVPRRERGVVQIRLELGSDGKLLDVHAATDGSFDFAEAARQAARAAAPFPPFPLMVDRSKMVINFAVVFQYAE